MTAKEIRIEMVKNYNGAETISYKTKKEAAEWIIQNFDCKPSTARYLANEACNMAWTFNIKGGYFSNKKEPGSKNTTVRNRAE